MGGDATATGKRTVCISCDTIREVAGDNCQKQTHWLLVRQNGAINLTLAQHEGWQSSGVSFGGKFEI